MSKWPHPPRLQILTSRTYWVLTVLYMSELHEIFRLGSECITQIIDTNSSGIRSHPVLQDSRVILQGHSEYWWTFSSKKLRKLTVLVQNTFLSKLTPMSMLSGTILDSKMKLWHQVLYLGCLLKIYYVTSIFRCHFQASRRLQSLETVFA